MKVKKTVVSSVTMLVLLSTFMFTTVETSLADKELPVANGVPTEIDQEATEEALEPVGKPKDEEPALEQVEPSGTETASDSELTGPEALSVEDASALITPSVPVDDENVDDDFDAYVDQYGYPLLRYYYPDSNRSRYVEIFGVNPTSPGIGVAGSGTNLRIKPDGDEDETFYTDFITLQNTEVPTAQDLALFSPDANTKTTTKKSSSFSTDNGEVEIEEMRNVHVIDENRVQVNTSVKNVGDLPFDVALEEKIDTDFKEYDVGVTEPVAISRPVTRYFPYNAGVSYVPTITATQPEGTRIVDGRFEIRANSQFDPYSDTVMAEFATSLRPPIYNLQPTWWLHYIYGVGNGGSGTIPIVYYDPAVPYFSDDKKTPAGEDSLTELWFPDETLQPGQQTIFSYVVYFGESSFPPELEITSLVGTPDTPLQVTPGQIVPVDGRWRDFDSTEISVGVSVDDGVEVPVVSSVTGTPAGDVHDLPADTTYTMPTTPGLHKLTFTAEDTDGTRSVPYDVYVKVGHKVTEKFMQSDGTTPIDIATHPDKDQFFLAGADYVYAPKIISGWAPIGYRADGTTMTTLVPIGTNPLPTVFQGLVADHTIAYVYGRELTVSEQIRDESNNTIPGAPADQSVVIGENGKYMKAHPTIAGYDYVGYKLGTSQTVNDGDPAFTVTAATTVTFVYKPSIVYVCKIGTTGYETLEAAIIAANNATGPTKIEMLVENYELKSSQPINKDITISTAGKTDIDLPYTGTNTQAEITLGTQLGTDPLFKVNTGAKFTLDNIKLDGNGTVETTPETSRIYDSSGNALITNYGTTTISGDLASTTDVNESAIVEDYKGTSSAIVNETGAMLNIAGRLENNTGQNGGALNIKAGTANMTGGSITGNTATGDGGGINIASTGTLIVDSGVVNNNHAASKGGGVYQQGKMSVKGKVEVKENTSGATNVLENVYLVKTTTDKSQLASANYIQVNGILTTGSEIGVTTEHTQLVGDKGKQYTIIAAPTTEEDLSAVASYFKHDQLVRNTNAYPVLFDRRYQGENLILDSETSVPFHFTKVDAADPAKPLEGATFKLYVCEQEDHPVHDSDVVTDAIVADGNCWVPYKDESGTVAEVTSNEDGIVEFGTLADNDYLLVETRSPVGYEKPTGQWLITINSAELMPDGDTIYPVAVEAKGDRPPLAYIDGDTNHETIDDFKFQNMKQQELPFNGGKGIYLFIVTGLVMMGGSTLLLVKNRQKHRFNG